MVYPNDPFGQYSNPDSVKINTCDSAGRRYAKGWFSVSFTKCVIEPEYAPADSSVYVSWQDIDTNFYNLRNFFDSLEQRFGKFTLLKVMPQITDTSLPGCKEYHLRFDNEVNIESVESFFIGAPEVFQCMYMNRATILLSDPVFYHPHDRAFQVGIVKDDINFPEVKIEANDEIMRKRRLGGYAGLYLSHVPLAWEITRGKADISIGIEDIWKEPKDLDFDGIPDDKVHPDVNNTNFKQFGKRNDDNSSLLTNKLTRNYHGLGIAGIIAGIEHTDTDVEHPKYGTIGVAPNCKNLFGTNNNVNCSEGYGCIDTDPIHEGIQPPDVINCSVLIGADSKSWLHGVVECAAIGNEMPIGGFNFTGNISEVTDNNPHSFQIPRNDIVINTTSNGNNYLRSARGEVLYQVMTIIARLKPGKKLDTNKENYDFVAVLQRGVEDNKFASKIHNDIGDVSKPTKQAKSIGVQQVNYIPSKHTPPNWPQNCENIYMPGRYNTDFNLRTRYFTEFVPHFTMPPTNNVQSGTLQKFDTNGNFVEAAFTDVIVHGGIMAPNYLEPNKNNQNPEEKPEPIVWGLGGSSFAAPVVAGTVALMRSIDKYLGAELKEDNTPKDKREMQERAYNIVTFTAEKEPDLLYNNTVAKQQYYGSGGESRLTTIPDNAVGINNTDVGLPVNKWIVLNPGEYISGYVVMRDGQSSDEWKVLHNKPITLKNDNFDWDKMALNYTVQTTDPLKRSWAHRHGFGHLNAYRAVIQSVPTKGRYEYKNSTDWTSDWSAITTAKKIDGRQVLHLGSKTKERGEQRDGTGETSDIINVLKYGGYRFEKAGYTVYNAEEYENNQGETLFNPTSNTDFPVGEGQTLAIDGIIQQTQSSKKLVTIKTTTGESGKILATGYLDEVTLHGTMKLDHLNVYADDDAANPKGAVIIEGATPSELWGKLKLYGDAIVDIKSGGKLILRAGGEIHLEGNKDLTIGAGATLELGHGSIIRTRVPRDTTNTGVGVPTGSIKRAIIVESDGKLVVPDNVFFQQIDGKVIVKDGGQFIIGKNSNVQMAQFEVQPGGKLILDEGCTLELDEYESICNGHLVVNSAVKQSSEYDIWPATPTENPARVTITGLRECGKPAAVAAIKCSYDLSSVPNPMTETTRYNLQGSLKLRYTDVKNVRISAFNVYMPPVEHCTFSGTRVLFKKITAETGNEFPFLFTYEYDRTKRISPTRTARFGDVIRSGIGIAEFRDDKFFDDDNVVDHKPKVWARIEKNGIPEDNNRPFYTISGLRLRNCRGVAIGGSESADSCLFERLAQGIKITGGVWSDYVSHNTFTDNAVGAIDDGVGIRFCQNTFNGNDLGLSRLQCYSAQTFDNTFSDGIGILVSGGSRQTVRSNKFEAHRNGIRFQFAGSADMTGRIYRAVIVNGVWTSERVVHGRNKFSTSGDSEWNKSDFKTKAAQAESDLYFYDPASWADMECGLNVLSLNNNNTIIEQPVHLYKQREEQDNPIPLATPIAVRTNNWLDYTTPSGLVRRNDLVPLSGGTPLNEGLLQIYGCDETFAADACVITPPPPPYDPRWPAQSVFYRDRLTGEAYDGANDGSWPTAGYADSTLDFLFERALAQMQDTAIEDRYRVDKLYDAALLAQMTDTASARADTLIALLSRIAYDTTDTGYLRRSALHVTARLFEATARYADADTVYQHILQAWGATDSVPATMGRLRLRPYITDTSRGSVFDSVTAIYDAELLRSLFPIMPDTSGGLVKPPAPIADIADGEEFALAVNEPNPFSSITVIHYRLPESCFATLAVYDALGNRVATVASGTEAKGLHAVGFDRTGLASGIYHYRLQTPFGIRSRTMIIH